MGVIISYFNANFVVPMFLHIQKGVSWHYFAAEAWIFMMQFTELKTNNNNYPAAAKKRGIIKMPLINPNKSISKNAFLINM